MKKVDLDRLKSIGAIWGYEVFSEDKYGNVTDVRLLLPSEPNRRWITSMLGSAYKRIRLAQTPLGGGNRDMYKEKV